MGFSTPGLLPFIALAAIPIIIHILSRLRLRHAPFPSLILLRTVRRERFSWVRLKEILLLILRTLALASLLLALARPYLTRSIPGIGQATDIIIVIDDSYSTTYADRWENCLSAARKLIRSIGTDRKVILLTASGQIQQDKPVPRGPALALLDSLRPTSLAPKLDSVLKRASTIAESIKASVVVITDRQERSLSSNWHADPGVNITLLDIGSDTFNNAGISRLYPEDRFAAAGKPVRIKADIFNYGSREVTRTAALSLDGQKEEKVLKIPPRTRRTIIFASAVSKPGTYVGQLELRSDSLGTDDKRYIVVHLPEKTHILIVESASITGRYVSDALTADSAARFQVDLVKVKRFSRCDPRNYQVIVIMDPASLKASDWTRFGFYLSSGGAGLLMPGLVPADTSRIGPYIRSFGLVRPAGFVSTSEIDTTHPILERIKLTRLASARIWQYSRLDAKGNLVLARLSDHNPFILENLAHRLIIWAIAPTPEFSDFIYKAVFVPLLHRTVSYLAQISFRTEYIAGDTIRLQLDNSSALVVNTPKGRIRLEPTTRRGRPTVTLTNTSLPGIYTFKSETENKIFRTVAVNPLAEEGNLIRFSSDRLKSQGIQLYSGTLPESADFTVPLLYLAAAAFAAELLLLF